jgi:hypothetical protein
MIECRNNHNGTGKAGSGDTNFLLFFFGTKENIVNFSIISSIFSSCLHANEINKFKEDFSFKFPNDISITSQNSTTPQQQQM